MAVAVIGLTGGKRAVALNDNTSQSLEPGRVFAATSAETHYWVWAQQTTPNQSTQEGGGYQHPDPVCTVSLCPSDLSIVRNNLQSCCEKLQVSLSAASLVPCGVPLQLIKKNYSNPKVNFRRALCKHHRESVEALWFYNDFIKAINAMKYDGVAIHSQSTTDSL